MGLYNTRPISKLGGIGRVGVNTSVRALGFARQATTCARTEKEVESKVTRRIHTTVKHMADTEQIGNKPGVTQLAVCHAFSFIFFQ